MMKLLSRTSPGLAVAAALILLVGALAPAQPASAAPPVNARTYPVVRGVDGSAMSVTELNLSVQDKLQVVSELAPAVVTVEGGVTTPAMVTEYRLARNGRNYIQISGRYCKNKSGGDVFKADGAPVEAGLTC
jgi:hypothetical protein